MKTIEEIAPIWTDIVKTYGYIPYEIVENKGLVNNLIPAITLSACCFVGEARGGGCYANPGNLAYCKICDEISMEFYNLAGDENWSEEEYNNLCQCFEAHYNEAHSDKDKC